MQGRVGVFDSGVGGLSVWAQIRRQLPNCPVIYYADQANFPYGTRSSEELRALSVAIVEDFLRHDVGIIAIACNSASAAALKYLRERYPQLAFVGMEPAIKPAVHCSLSGVVAVLATAVTLEGELLENVIARYSRGARVIRQPCQGLVECVESGLLEGDSTRALLQQALDPCVEQGADTLVLGCTHYSFIAPLISQLYPQLQVIDPAPAVARRVASLLGGGQPERSEDKLEKCGVAPQILVTSAEARSFQAIFRKIFQGDSGEDVCFMKVGPASSLD